MFEIDLSSRKCSLGAVLHLGIQLEDVLADMAAETKSSNVVVEKTASQQYIDMKVRLQEVETFRYVLKNDKNSVRFTQNVLPTDL